MHKKVVLEEISNTYREATCSDALNVRDFGFRERPDEVGTDEHAAHDALEIRSVAGVRMSLWMDSYLFVAIPRLSRRVGRGQGDFKGVTFKHDCNHHMQCVVNR